MKLFDRTIQGFLAASNRLFSTHFKLKVLMIMLEKLLRSAGQTPINLTHPMAHGELSIVADGCKLQIGWHLPSNTENQCDELGCVDHTSNDNPIQQPQICDDPTSLFSRLVDEIIKSTRPDCSSAAADSTTKSNFDQNPGLPSQ